MSSHAPALLKLGAATQVLNSDNSFLGTVTVIEGVLSLASDTALSEGAYVSVATGAEVVVDDVNVTIAELYSYPSGSGTVRLDGDSLTVSGAGATNTFDGAITGTGSFVVDQDGLIQTLTGASDYTGATVISRGTLRAGIDGSLSGGSEHRVGSGGRLEVASNAFAAIGSLADGADGGGTVILEDDAILSVGRDGSATTFSGRLTGHGLLSLEGGALTLRGNSVIDAVDICDCGILTIAGDGASFTANGDPDFGGGATVSGTLNVRDGALFSASQLLLLGEMNVDGAQAGIDTETLIALGAGLTVSNGGVLTSYSVAAIGAGFPQWRHGRGRRSRSEGELPERAELRHPHRRRRRQRRLRRDDDQFGLPDRHACEHARQPRHHHRGEAGPNLAYPPGSPTPPAVFTAAAITPNQFATAAALDTLPQSGPELGLYNAILFLPTAADELLSIREAGRSLAGAKAPPLRASPEAAKNAAVLNLGLTDKMAYLDFVPEIIRRRDGAKGFEVLPRHWVVERTFGWMIRWRRLVRDYERRVDAIEAIGEPANPIWPGFVNRRPFGPIDGGPCGLEKPGESKRRSPVASSGSALCRRRQGAPSGARLMKRSPSKLGRCS